MKGTQLEGGVCVPFVIRWPGHLPAGKTYRKPISTLDLLPTFVAAAGSDPSKLAKVDGVNLLPYLRGDTNSRPHERLYWRPDLRAAVRVGDWKMIRLPDRPAHLYNIADKRPKRLRQLFQTLFRWEQTHSPPLWQLKTKYLQASMNRFDRFKRHAE